MYRKRKNAPKPDEAALPVLVFVDGSSISSRVVDLSVPRKGEYSIMNVFADFRFDCWTMDHDNYGRSGRTSGNSDIASGVEDLKARMDVLADAELKYSDQVPTGIYIDMTANLPVVDPRRVMAPAMLVRGEYDGIASVDDLLDFYRRLPNSDRQFVILPSTTHSVALAINRQLFWLVMHEFLTMPVSMATSNSRRHEKIAQFAISFFRRLFR